MTGPTGLPRAAHHPRPARGLMLALIAMANVAPLPRRPDRSATAATRPASSAATGSWPPCRWSSSTAACTRCSRPSSATGWRGWPTARRRGVLRRRGRGADGVGALHGVLLFPGDIIGAYGLVVLLIAPVVATGPAASSSRGLLAAAGAIAAFGGRRARARAPRSGCRRSRRSRRPRSAPSLAAHPGSGSDHPVLRAAHRARGARRRRHRPHRHARRPGGHRRRLVALGRRGSLRLGRARAAPGPGGRATGCRRGGFARPSPAPRTPRAATRARSACSASWDCSASVSWPGRDLIAARGHLVDDPLPVPVGGVRRRVRDGGAAGAGPGRG